jgi:hypothetical protein
VKQSSEKKQRLSLRLFNQAHRFMERLGRRKLGWVESEPSLHEAACKAVGFDDFGDEGYLEGLRVLLQAYDRESRLTPFGRMLVEQQLLGILKNRLHVQRAWTETPEILEHEIRRPIFILGLPRTGTTALHQLIGQDPGIQVLEYWLAAAPLPRPPRSQWESHPRFQEAVRDLESMYSLDPSLKTMHVMTADGPEECRHLLQQTLTDDTFDCNATIPSYSDWYARHDMLGTYTRHRDLLKLIGSPQPKRRWVLKYPAHMRNLRTLFKVYPDACIVQTHRDPAKVLPSICSLVAGWRVLYEDDPDRRAIAEWQLDLWATGMEDALEVRRERDSSQFFDLHFREVLADPLGAVKRAYDYFHVEMTEEAEQGLRKWRAANPPGKHGEHRYRAEEFGLTDEAMAERFAPYTEYFQIERETSS